MTGLFGNLTTSHFCIVGVPPMTGTATLTVNVQDINEHGPQFKNKPHIWAPKQVTNNQKIATLEIIDRDSAENGPPFQATVCQNQNIEGCRDFRFTLEGGVSLGSTVNLF